MVEPEAIHRASHLVAMCIEDWRGHHRFQVHQTGRRCHVPQIVIERASLFGDVPQDVLAEPGIRSFIVWVPCSDLPAGITTQDRKSTRLNSNHSYISSS